MGRHGLWNLSFSQDQHAFDPGYRLHRCRRHWRPHDGLRAVVQHQPSLCGLRARLRLAQSVLLDLLSSFPLGESRTVPRPDKCPSVLFQSAK